MLDAVDFNGDGYVRFGASRIQLFYMFRFGLFSLLLRKHIFLYIFWETFIRKMCVCFLPTKCEFVIIMPD